MDEVFERRLRSWIWLELVDGTIAQDLQPFDLCFILNLSHTCCVLKEIPRRGGRSKYEFHQRKNLSPRRDLKSNPPWTSSLRYPSLPMALMYPVGREWRSARQRTSTIHGIPTPDSYNLRLRCTLDWYRSQVKSKQLKPTLKILRYLKLKLISPHPEALHNQATFLSVYSFPSLDLLSEPLSYSSMPKSSYISPTLPASSIYILTILGSHHPVLIPLQRASKPW